MYTILSDYCYSSYLPLSDPNELYAIPCAITTGIDVNDPLPECQEVPWRGEGEEGHRFAPTLKILSFTPRKKCKSVQEFIQF